MTIKKSKEVGLTVVVSERYVLSFGIVAAREFAERSSVSRTSGTSLLRALTGNRKASQVHTTEIGTLGELGHTLILCSPSTTYLALKHSLIIHRRVN